MDEKRLHLDPKLNRELREPRSRKTLLLVAATLILAALVLASLAVLNVRARGPASVPAAVVAPVLNPSLRLVPAEGAPGTSIVVTGEGWRQWDTVTTGWRGEYYDNRELRGSPVLVRDDTEVNLDWGRSAPAVGLPADDFSVRWVRTAEFDGTTYRFHVWADDGFRLWVDDQPILDAWWGGGLRERTMDCTLVQGTHHLRLEYYERTGEARIHAWWEKVASFSYPDWKGEYWSNRDLSGSPALVRNDPSLNFDWGWEAPATGLPADSFSARWTRAGAFDAATYRFYVLVDGGARLWVDGHLILDTWRDGGVREVTADHAMAGGLHDLRVEFCEYSGEARVHLWWESVE